MSNNTLQRSLLTRHLMMMSIGGVIGAGYFFGVGGAIKLAGPAVLIAYVIGGLIAFLVTMLLTEMAVAKPVAGSFHIYASMAFGPLIGFLTGWTYWLAFLIGPASEVIAVGTILHAWLPIVPIWEFCLGVAILLTLINLISAHVFGETEFWLSLVKVVALISFIIIGLIVMITKINPTVTLNNFTQFNGFAPHGVIGIFSAMMLVIFAYGGTEVIGTAAEESHNPSRDLPKVIKGTVLRIMLLYLVSIAVLLTIVPWQQAGVSESPFAAALMILGGKKHGLILSSMMNFVILTAALSCINTGIFATSRMLFSLAREGYFPRIFAKTHPQAKTPMAAIIVSSSVLYLGVLAAAYFPNAYVWLASLSGFGFLFAWFMTVISHGRVRRIIQINDPGKLKWLVPFSPFTQIVAGLLIASVFVGAALSNEGRVILIAGALWLVFANCYYFLFARHKLIK